MKLSLAIPILSAVAIAASVSAAKAFEVVTGDPQFRSDTLSTKLSDPEDIIQDMSQRYNGNSATIAHFGNTTIGIIGPNRSYGAYNSPFVPDPAAGTVPSKREW
jgi:hypothetical protein